MTNIVVQEDCENAPKKEFIRDFEIAFTGKDTEFILESMADDIYWEMVGDKVTEGKAAVEKDLSSMLDGSMKELVIENIITHGNVGSANGTMTFADGSEFSFCDVFTFTSHAKDAKIKKLQAFIIQKKKE